MAILLAISVNEDGYREVLGAAADGGDVAHIVIAVVLKQEAGGTCPHGLRIIMREKPHI